MKIQHKTNKIPASSLGNLGPGDTKLWDLNKIDTEEDGDSSICEETFF